MDWRVIHCPGCGRKIAAPVRPASEWLFPDQWCRLCGGAASTSPADISRVLVSTKES